MVVGKPVGAVVLEPSEAKALVSPASVGVGGWAVVVGAKARLVGTSSVVASSLPVGTIECGASVVVEGTRVVSGVDSTEGSVLVTIGTIGVAESSDSEAVLVVGDGLTVSTVVSDASDPEDAEDPEVAEAAEVVDASEEPVSLDALPVAED